ncbi:ATP-binding response regulator [endosymbiont of unidentified scaly snail isolate Monju]|uniref:ATP-binding response regulator n=1 Tax=endosymbiont of unidentified scaly snail isolate Monju TaxID=1248727 RepID=UPI00038921AA|nr:ATP-binding protein [endosymbiont of unidentified scaly snail isolate Monju]BAN70217.1 two-component system hybrid sensor histidine kinase and response regulator [endosymbiont of unidentified scaly snail isolate Monju]
MNDNVDPIERLQGYLQTARMQGVKPFYLLIDDDFRLRAPRGQARFYGFDGLSPDSDLSDQLLFLVGQDQDPGATLHLPMLELPNGTYCELHAIRLKNGWGLAFCDASIQQQLQARYQQMAHELALAQYQLKHQHQQLQEANEAKSRFIARMSHEFRTPLSSILGFTELAHEDMGDPWRLNADLEAISRGANYLLSLVDNLLDHAVLEQGELIIHPTSCEPYRLIDDLEQLFQPAAHQKGLSLAWWLDAGVPDHLWIDEVRLRQVMVNLIGNAIKFTQEGGITVSMEWHDERLKVQVEDTGSGISESEQARLFEAFMQADAGKSARGAGLGLTISREIVRRMGGDLTLRSRPGRGTRIRFDIKAPARAGSEAGKVSLEGMRILLLEQDPDIRKLLTIFLKTAGAELLEAGGQQKALELLSKKPQLALCHLLDPPQHRLLLRVLRQAGFQGPVLAIGSQDDQDLLNEILRAGYADLITTPIRRTELLARLTEVHSKQEDRA